MSSDAHLVYDVRIANCCVDEALKYWVPPLVGLDLHRLVRAQLVSNAYAIHGMVVVVDDVGAL